MSSRKGKKVEEEEFEVYVRSSLNKLCQDIKEIKDGQAKIRRDLQLLRNEVSSNKNERKKIRRCIEKLTADLHDVNCRVDRIESDLGKYSKDVGSLYERLGSLERYSRDFNLRFYNIPEVAGEDSLSKLAEIIGNGLNIRPTIENANGVGTRRGDGSQRPILEKFLYRPKGKAMILKKKIFKNDVRTSDDLIWDDREGKKQLRTVMNEAYEDGNRPRFHHGKLYLCLSLAYITIKWGTALTELCLLGSKDTNSIWVKMAMGKPIAALIIINQITKRITK